MTLPPSDPQTVALNRERKRRLRSRNLAVFGCLLGFVLLVYGVTVIKIKLGYGP